MRAASIAIYKVEINNLLLAMLKVSAMFTEHQVKEITTWKLLFPISVNSTTCVWVGNYLCARFCPSLWGGSCAWSRYRNKLKKTCICQWGGVLHTILLLQGIGIMYTTEFHRRCFPCIYLSCRGMNNGQKLGVPSHAGKGPTWDGTLQSWKALPCMVC